VYKWSKFSYSPKVAPSLNVAPQSRSSSKFCRFTLERILNAIFLSYIMDQSSQPRKPCRKSCLKKKETKNGSIVHSPVVCKQNISFENTVSSPKKEKTLPNVTMSSHLTRHFKLVTFSRQTYLWGVILCFQL